ncbi:MAG: hypothetical protein AAGU27_24845 [Dehalobacterium sp.]
MGQHKHNLTAQFAKAGLLPAKKKPRGKRETERLIYEQVERYLRKTMFG